MIKEQRGKVKGKLKLKGKLNATGEKMKAIRVRVNMYCAIRRGTKCDLRLQGGGGNMVFETPAPPSLSLAKGTEILTRRSTCTNKTGSST
jgi:hypothetical protein